MKWRGKGVFLCDISLDYGQSIHVNTNETVIFLSWALLGKLLDAKCQISHEKSNQQAHELPSLSVHIQSVSMSIGNGLILGHC